MSIWTLVRDRKISLEQGVKLSEVWIGQELAKVPGGEWVAKMLGDAADIAKGTPDSAVEALVHVAEAPLDAFLMAKLPAPLGALAVADANAAIDEQAARAKAFIDLQAANLKQNVALGIAQAHGQQPGG